MSLFRTAQAPAPETSGTDVLREALKSWGSHGGLPRISTDIGVGLDALEKFSLGQRDLPAEAKQKLAEQLYGANYDAESNRLVSTRKPAVPLSTCSPPSIAEMNLPPPPTPSAGPPVPVKPVPPQPDPRKRPGWS